jgi:glycine betaine/choline ABC-type transport system substrate-binding protein
VALLFTTDPDIVRSGFVVLDDDRHLQPTENATAVLSRATSERYGPPVGDLLDRVSLHLDTQEPTRPDGKMELEGAPAALVAANWLRTHGFAANGTVHG